MRVLGLDPGSRSTGFGVVERQGNRLRCLAHGCIRPKATAGLPERLATIAEATDALIREWAPGAAVVEEAFHHEHARSSLVLGHVRGALLVVIVRSRLELAEYAPRTIKLGVTGSGAATKPQVAAMVSRLLGIHAPLGADAADALAGAICHLQRRPVTYAAPATRSRSRRAWEALLAARSGR
jgi:crossover junction endodeoxyribonuclease RuvC